MSRTLILVRHGESDHNAKNLFTGWRDAALTAKGIMQAEDVGARLQRCGLTPDLIFTSDLQRTIQSGLAIKAATGNHAELISAGALNERDYGQLTGLNKDEARARWGGEQVQRWRRSLREAPPGGESLSDTVARVLPYLIRHILPRVMDDQIVLVVGHGNVLRALTFGLEEMTEAQIADVEFEVGNGVIYSFAPNTEVLNRTELAPD